MPYWDPNRPDELVTIAEYDSVGPAVMDRMLLESAGIEALVCDENVARITGPFHPLLGARIRLQVLESEVQDALRILNAPAAESAGDGTV